MVRWRVSHLLLEADVVLVLGHALLTKSLVMVDAKHIDWLVMFGTNGILLLHHVDVGTHLSLHQLGARLPWQIVTHFYLSVHKLISQRK